MPLEAKDAKEENINKRLTACLTRGVSIFDKASIFDRWINSFGLAVFFVMVCFTFINVLLRYAFHKPIIGSTEITELMLIIVVYFGIAYTQLWRGHVSMDILTTRLSEKPRVAMEILVCLLGIGIFGLLIWRTSVNVLDFVAGNQVTLTLRIPAAPFAALVPLGCTLVLLLYMRDFFQNILEGIRLQFSRRLWLLLFGIAILVLVWGILWIQPTIMPMSPVAIGAVGLIVSFIFFLTGMPIAFGLIIVGFLFMAHVRGLDAGLGIVGSMMYRTVADYNYAVIAFFVVMGFFVSAAGLGEDMYRAAYRWIGNLRGGLASATVAACAAMGAVVAGTATEIVALGPIALPEMKRYKYDVGLANGAMASGSTIGALIPPSTGMILYAILTDESIGDLFVGGIIPGLLVTFLFIGLIYFRCRRNPSLGPPAGASSWREKMSSLKAGGPIAILFVLVIGGLYVGLFTPTEAGGIGAFGAFLIGLIMKRFTWKKFVGALIESGKMSTMAYILLGGAMIFGYFVTASRLPMTLADFVVGLAVSPSSVIIIILFIYLLLGCIMPAIPMIIITVPIFYPVAIALSYDPIWFGVLVVMMMVVATITPPFGINLFILKQISGESMTTIFRGVLPFAIAEIVVIALVFAFEPLAIWLPSVMR